MSNHLTWQELLEGFNATAPFYQQATQTVLAEGNFQQGDWFNCFSAYGLEPQPVKATFLNAQFPYVNMERQQQTLANTAERGLLTVVSDHAYQLSENGRQGIVGFFQAAVSALSQVEPLSFTELNRLAALLHKIVKTTLNAPEPPQKTQLLLSRRTDPGMSAHPTARIDQYLTDLQRYRDDAHLASWAHYGISGQSWEALTFIWRDQAHTAEKLAETLSFRGHSVDSYAVALNELVQRGWVVVQEEGYVLTDNGRIVRETAESLTDTYTFVGWSTLSEAEQVELTDLLSRFVAGCRELAAAQTPAN